MALDRETLVRTALRLIDEGGLDSLTLRKLAAELGVQAPALYWHFKNKRELLDAVATHLVAEQRSTSGTAPDDGQPWWEWIEQRLLDGRRTLLSHRDSALIAAGNRPTPDALPASDATLSSLAAGGVPPGEALLFTLAAGNYLLGGVLERQSAEAREPTDTETETFRLMQDAERYPTLAAAVAELLANGGRGPDSADSPEGAGGLDDAVFRFGLGLMIDGLRARLTRADQDSGP
ncbi:TetR family transcriptional regulator [Cryptosporangium aurantiacum]|uniref:Transcriptional regulator, TetR family n=1 Tax=Cryptosporangium aurantiacum TaxID=134849 RepID=A0A1M7Q6Q7_9ACTN|nr:TetR/AcrR family transcriptional regulator C-terminal domain-containing protein [Cryptosporangium aurantiacum]SHN26197.1 transcriptional regulator, TetR family [Cryptosporangium aurantiacum]